jgi:hypothetical protein
MEDVLSLLAGDVSLPLEPDANATPSSDTKPEFHGRSRAAARRVAGAQPEIDPALARTLPPSHPKSSPGREGMSRPLLREATAPFFFRIDQKGPIQWFICVNYRSALFLTMDPVNCEVFEKPWKLLLEDKTLRIETRKWQVKSEKDQIGDRLEGAPKSLPAVLSFFVSARSANGLPPFSNLTYSFYDASIMSPIFLAAFSCLGTEVRALVPWSVWSRVVDVYFDQVVSILFKLEFGHVESLGGLFTNRGLVPTIASLVFEKDELFVKFVARIERTPANFLTEFAWFPFSPKTKVMLYYCLHHAAKQTNIEIPIIKSLLLRMSGLGRIPALARLFAPERVQPGFEKLLREFMRFPADYYAAPVTDAVIKSWKVLIQFVGERIGEFSDAVVTFSRKLTP